MSRCTFFGHRDYRNERDDDLKTAIEHLITHDQVTEFYVGHQGNFDKTVCRLLKDLQKSYPHIRYCVVLAYIPTTSSTKTIAQQHPTILPEGAETVLPKFAILHRNRWMTEQSGYVIAYITRSYGGAAQCVQLAQTKNKTVTLL